MRYAADATELIGRTPLLRLGRLCPDHTVLAKCEFLNPVSLKDRPILQILKDAESEGRIKPGDTLIEATSGNTGMAVTWHSRKAFWSASHRAPPHTPRFAWPKIP